MNLKQAQAILSDLLMRCEEQDVALSQVQSRQPSERITGSFVVLEKLNEGVQLCHCFCVRAQDPLESITVAIECLRSEMKHEMRKSQLETSLDAMKTKYGFRTVGRLGRQSSHEKRKSAPADEGETEDPATAPSPRKCMRPNAAHAGAVARGSTHSPTAKKHQRIQDEITATPAKRPENQRLVDQLVQLGEYELHTGHSQRGIARMRAAKQLHDTMEVIKSGAQAKRLDRIGTSAAEKIDVLLHQGLSGVLKGYGANVKDLPKDTKVKAEEDEEEISEKDVESTARSVETHKPQRSDEGAQKQPSKDAVETDSQPASDAVYDGDDDEKNDEEEEEEEGDEEEEEEYREEEGDEDEDDEEESPTRYKKRKTSK